jgi:hypothetical protein
MGLDHAAIDELLTELQRKIMEGQAHIELLNPENTPEPDIADEKPKPGEATK